MILIRHLLYTLIIFSIAECSIFHVFRSIFNMGHDAEDFTKNIYKRSIKHCDLSLCSDDQLMVYLAELQAINPESIINLSTFDELYILCKQVSDSLEKMDEFLKTCRVPNEKDLYIQLIKGVNRLYNVICEDGCHLRKDFEQHFDCLKQLHDDFETCFGPPDWTESTNKKDICKAYKDIGDCYYIKTAKVCGKKAARVMRKVVQAVIDSIIIPRCSMGLYPNVDDAMSDSQGYRIIYNINLVILIVFYLIKFI